MPSVASAYAMEINGELAWIREIALSVIAAHYATCTENHSSRSYIILQFVCKFKTIATETPCT